MNIKSNAKINYNLKIVGKKDGFHLLDSIFVPIDIYDDIEIMESDRDQIIGMDIDFEKNIIYKAICLIRELYDIDKKYIVMIKKNIPMEAGLGGGSSNAAFTLKLMNEMNNLNLSLEKLAEIGLKLGSDVPFFIYNKTASVKGRGEIINPIAAKKLFGVLVFDDLKFSTKEVYDTYDKIEKVGTLNNDLEEAARILPNGKRIEEIEKDLLNNGAYYASLSGSGGAVFGLFNSIEECNRIEKQLKNRYYYVKSFKSIG